MRKLVLPILILTALIGLSVCACAAEYRAFWVDAWGAGVLSQSQVDKLLGVPGTTSKGDIRNANCNTVIVQVRRNCDANYPSSMGEPYMSGLSPSDFNSLQAVINAAHDTTGGKQRIDVHCWIVTFRTSGGLVYTQHDDTPTGSLTNLDNYWPTRTDSGTETSDKAFDPGHPLCEEYLTDVCMDIVNNFDVDGLNYDYIRFTANNQGYNPTSVARYNARYGLSGQPSSSSEQWKQWRRDQVTALVRRVYAKIQASKPWVKQSGSTVTWNPSPAASTRAAFQGTRPYYDVYSDWDAWQQEGIVDMNVPMTYYNWASLPTDYTRWINFIKDRKFNRHVVIGPGIYLNSLGNAIDEILMTRTASPVGNYAQGFCGYSYRVPYSGGTWDAFSPQFTAQVCPGGPVDIPDMPWKSNPTKGHISGTVTIQATGAWADGATVSITGPESRSMLCDGTGFYAFIDLTPGEYVITASKTGYPDSQTTANVAIGSVTGNMYVRNLVLGGTPPPTISNVQASNIGTNSATITWTTDQAATSKVDYGLTTSYGSSTPLDSNLVTSHSMSLGGLAPSTLYHYRVTSSNTNGTSYSSDYTFTTNGPPIISNVQATDIGATSAVITWNTSTASSGLVNYGLTSGYGSQEIDPNGNTTSHTVSISDLTPETTYHYQCVSTNAYGTDQTTDLTFATTAVVTEIVIDNTDPGWSNTSPGGATWSVGSNPDVPKIGTNYLYTAGSGSTSSITRSCRWTPNITVAGIYDVYAYYQIGANRNERAPYTTYYDGGQVTSIQNQYSSTPNLGGWFLVAADKMFQAGSAGYVELTNASTDTKYISADAAKFVLKQAADTTPPVMNSVTDDQYTTSTTSLAASWGGSDPESGIQRYELAVGSTPGGTDVKAWASAGVATSGTIYGLSLTVGNTYYISAR
ncbi:MAG TPA: family 10 glycosylhydrolase, partial [Armatimonadota bacterium]|nr:family 10 glycosylhydrolase [Armatimonadota bacterium]